VAEWKPPVQRGRRTFDDKAFYQSLAQQFERRKALSDRQRAALKRMLRNYSAQIPGFAELAQTYGIPERGVRRDKAV
jgi:hypothetical protein